MFERKSEKILLSIALSLLAVLILQILVIAPLWSFYGTVDDDITDLEEDIMQARRLLEYESQILGRADLINQQLRVANEEGQNKFRQYMESEADLVVVKSSTPKSETDFPEKEGFKLITYDLVLEGTVEMLRVFIDKLDRSGELLRIDKVLLTNASLEERTVTMMMTVSTVAQKAEQPESEFSENSYREPL